MRAVEAAAEVEATASQVSEALTVTRDLPPWPPDCRVHERTGVVAGDPLNVATLKGDQATGRANARIDRCTGWYNDLRDGLRGEE
ncbi:MAG: hypothetical protein AAF739_00210 [Pseudomonadota bacterium]